MLNCVWSESPISADNRSWYALSTMLNNTLDKAELGFVHRNGFKELPPEADGAVVIIHGGHQQSELNELVTRVRNLKWALTIIIGDEDGSFPIHQFKGIHHKVWAQMPVPGVHDAADHFMICGFPHDAPVYLLRYTHEMANKSLNWFYAGQVNHEWRRQCVAALKVDGRGVLCESPGFWQGLPRDEYYREMSRANIVICPAGACTPDTLRVAEALEARCVPIVEDRWPPFFPRRGGQKTGYWRYVLGEEPPFPVVTSWADISKQIDKVLENWGIRCEYLQAWWWDYKLRLCKWMVEDINAIR